MSQKIKILASDSNNWKELVEENILWNLLFPRWWNPLFWILVFTHPLITGIACAISKKNKDSYLSSFFYGISESSIDISKFFHEYKV